MEFHIHMQIVDIKYILLHLVLLYNNRKSLLDNSPAHYRAIPRRRATGTIRCAESFIISPNYFFFVNFIIFGQSNSIFKYRKFTLVQVQKITLQATMPFRSLFTDGCHKRLYLYSLFASIFLTLILNCQRFSKVFCFDKEVLVRIKKK